MQPDQIQIQVRTRHGWEAIDLGFQMVRAWWKVLYGTWFAVVAPLMALWIYVLWSTPELALIGLWWLKPLCERLPLYVVSEALFASPPGVGDAIKNASRWLRGGTLASLTLYRASPARSMLLPVLQLEGLKGARRSLRAQQLIGPDLGRALWLLIACSAFQLAPLALGLGSMVLALLPPETSLLDAFVGLWMLGEPAERLRMLAILYALSLSLIEPIYVTCGFALYINRRIFVEGWDIELTFRKLSERIASQQSLQRQLAPVLALLVASSAAAPAFAEEPALAEEVESAIETEAATEAEACTLRKAQDASECIRAIVSDPVFGSVEEHSTWRWRFADDGDDPQLEEPSTGSASDVLSRLLQVLAAAGLLACVIAIARHWMRNHSPGSPAPGSTERAALPDDAVSLHPLEPEIELPPHLAAKARALYRNGDAASALSLLYRGALAHLAELGIDTPASATETECARRVQGAAREPLARDFDALVHAWQLAAYAHHEIPGEQFEALARSWELHFASTANTG